MPSLPDNTPLPRLKIKPYAVELYADLERGKLFVKLSFRHKKPGPLAAQLALVTDVLANLASAGYVILDTIDLRLAPSMADGGTSYRIHLSVPVAPLPTSPGEETAFLETLRTRY